jgi:hypothetical protein
MSQNGFQYRQAEVLVRKRAKTMFLRQIIMQLGS